ncbi:GtrA family protein [Actinokineospora terrae]|uniref:Putative flippase GtrA (Transmembrane translocase of bactoprenol-linked glucose) n=1 Tax=Actinokineospora terrae TaxID=155974 RepID=A0A1H9XK43_9PSEU|nr:GtrA family protein [Actinokineospora terrae]SES46484.1 Putative flippase GtrA (transmembrane translocase of bactoprenol-linked glucose) [Actinokineospora terrae]
MAEVRDDTQRVGLLQQLVRFVLVGGFCALVDSGAYWLLLQSGLWVHLAKALSFVLGTTTAYFLNKRFTFTDAADRGAGQAGGFALLYTVTFFVNVGTNALMLAVLPTFRWEYAVAWVIAQGVGTTINFVLLRTVVFRAGR